MHIERDTAKKKKLEEKLKEVSRLAMAEEYNCKPRELDEIISSEHQLLEKLRASGLSDADLLKLVGGENGISYSDKDDDISFYDSSENVGMGGNQNMNAMVKQAQRMQDEIVELQNDIEAREFTATVGGGAVEVVLTGKKTIKSLNIKPEVVNPEDIDMLQDLIISAVNEAVNNIEAVTEEEMNKVTGGVSLPGLF